MSKPAIPSSWAYTKLGKVTEYGRVNKAEPNEIEDSAWVLELEDIEKNTSKLLARVSFANRQSKSTKNRFEPGDILYGKLRPYLNKVIIADNPGYCTTEIIPLKAGQHLDNRYLFYWLKHPTFLGYVEAESHGLNMPRLGTDTGKGAPFILAPLNEQKRIADKLDAVLARVDACRDRLDRIPAILKRFRQSVLIDAVTGKLTAEYRKSTDYSITDLGWEIPDSWNLLTINEVAEVKGGKRLPKGKTLVSRNTGFPYIRAGQLKDGTVIPEEQFYLEADVQSQIARYIVNCGDVYITIVGACIGDAGVIPASYDGANLTENAAKLCDFKKPISSQFLAFWLRSQLLQDIIQSEIKSGAQGKLALMRIKTLLLPYPSIDEQTEIVRRVESLFDFADRLEAHYNTARAQVENLTPALLAKAFRGELVPQDPNDEPASELLAWIRAARPIEKPKKARQPTIRKAVRVPKENSTMTKSRQDDDVKNQPYLAGHLRLLEGTATVETQICAQPEDV